MAIEMLTKRQMIERCKAAGETCRNSSSGCTCHALSAYAPVAAPDQPPPMTMPGDLGERHAPPTEPPAYQPLRMLVLAVVLMLVGRALAELIALLRGQA